MLISRLVGIVKAETVGLRSQGAHLRLTSTFVILGTAPCTEDGKDMGNREVQDEQIIPFEPADLAFVNTMLFHSRNRCHP